MLKNPMQTYPRHPGKAIMGLIAFVLCLANASAMAQEVLYFSATNGLPSSQRGRELWRINPDNTLEIAADISPGIFFDTPSSEFRANDSNPADFFQFKDRLYFSAEKRTSDVEIGRAHV